MKRIIKDFIYKGDPESIQHLHEVLSLIKSEASHYVYHGPNTRGLVNVSPSITKYNINGYEYSCPVSCVQLGISHDSAHLVDPLSGVDIEIRNGDKISIKKTATYRVVIYRAELRTLVKRDNNAPKHKKFLGLIDTTRYTPIAEFVEVDGSLSNKAYWGLICNRIVNILMRESGISVNSFYQLYDAFLPVKYLTDPQPAVPYNITMDKRIAVFIITNIVTAFDTCDSSFFTPTIDLEITPFLCTSDSIIATIDILAMQSTDTDIDESLITFDARIGTSTFTNSRLEPICKACSASLSIY